MNLYEHCLVSVLKQLPILQDEQFPFFPNLHEDLDGLFPHLPRSSSLDELPLTIRKDLNVLAQYNHALSCWERKFSAKEEIRHHFEYWDYRRLCMVVYCSCGSCEECELWRKLNFYSIDYYNQLQPREADLSNSADWVEKIKTFIPPHLTHATSYIELQYDY